MRSRRSLVLVALVLAVGSALVWLQTRERGAAKVPEAAPPAAAGTPGAPAPVAAEEPASREPAACEAPAAQAPVPRPRAHERATIRARFLDTRKTPIAGVALREASSGADELARSAEDGKLEASVFATADGTRAMLETNHGDYVSRSFERVLRAGDVLDLGDVELAHGGSVSGRVVDASGVAVPLARVAIAAASHALGSPGTPEAPYNVSRSGACDAQGRFRFGGIPAGAMRAWATREKPPWSHSEPFAVRDDEETRDVEIVLARAPARDLQSLRLLLQAPDGSPLPRAQVVLRARSEHGMMLGALAVDAHGLAELPAERVKLLAGGTLDLEATDPQAQFGGVALLELPIAAGETVVRLTQGHVHQLVVQAADGTPITNYLWRRLDSARFTRPSWASASVQPVRGLRSLDYFQGSALLGHGEDLPRDEARSAKRFASGELPFVVQVDAPGYERAELGPFAGATAPEVITVTLVALPEIRGSVVHARSPVAGARVELLRAAASTVNGFPSRVDPQASGKSETDGEGRFRLSFHDAGSYIVQASTAELGVGEVGPLNLAPAGTQPELTIELLDPGRLEGRLLLPEGSAGEDWIVGASRGDGKAYSCRATHEGAFHFETLAPGRWLLRRLERELAGGELSWGAASVAAPDEALWPCLVRSGETTKVEIDLRQEAEITGTLGIAGWECDSWIASLEPDGITFGRGERVEDLHDGSTFRLHARPPGAYRLGLTAARKDGAGWRFESESLTLTPGTQSWSCPEPVGTLVLVNRRASATAFELTRELHPGRTSKISLELPARGELAVGGLFAGSWRLRRFENMQPSDEGSLEVQAGATVRFDKP